VNNLGIIPPHRAAILAQHLDKIRVGVQDSVLGSVRPHYITIGLGTDQLDSWFIEEGTEEEFRARGEFAGKWVYHDVHFVLFVCEGHILLTTDPDRVHSIDPDEPEGEPVIFIFTYDRAENTFAVLTLSWVTSSEDGNRYLIYKSITEGTTMAANVLAPFVAGLYGANP
jgi:hypothetical protein